MPNVPRPDSPDVHVSKQTGIENRELAEKINGGLSLGRHTHTERTGNVDGQVLWHHFGLTANAPHKVWHGLGRVPVWFDYFCIEHAATVYAVNMGSWTDEVMYLAADSKDFDVRLRIF